MPFINWVDDFSYGLSEVDDDHKRFVALINDFADGIDKGEGKAMLGKTLEKLINHVSYHFAHEEGIYLRANYPGYEAHKKEHEALTKAVLGMYDKFCLGEFETLPQEVLEFLKDWFYDHILHADKKFGVYLNSSGAAF